MDVDFEVDNEIPRLESEITTQHARGIVVVPTAFVNDAAIRGHLTAENMFHAICAGFVDGAKPDICQKCAACSDSFTCVKSGGVCAAGNGPMSVTAGSTK